MQLETVNNRLRVRFRYPANSPSTKLYCLSFGLTSTEEHRAIAQAVIARIQMDIVKGRVDTTLRTYRELTLELLHSNTLSHKVVRSYRAKPKSRREFRSPLSTSEVNRLLEALRDDRFVSKYSRYSHSHYADFIEALYITGCRNAELIGLQVKHCDFTLGRVEISSVLARSPNSSNSGKRRRKETKTGITRYLPMSDRLRVILVRNCARKLSDDLVFQSPTGKAIDDRMLQRRVIKPVLRRLGIPDRDLYSARHSFATRLIQQGIDLDRISYALGHKRISTTLDTYSHLLRGLETLPDL